MDGEAGWGEAPIEVVKRVLHEGNDVASLHRKQQRACPAHTQPLPGVIGSSSALLEAVRQVRIVAPTESTVLIQGETGTGKESAARAVHDLSKRKDGPFVRVNCAAVPAALLESELMGHERGAFTGAVARRVGRFELANGGTIFLDEIGEMPLELQPKLLRLLQEREFERLGGVHTLLCDARVVAATNRDLRAMVHEGTFRQDLYYRLSVFPIELPPLRKRRTDILSLVDHFSREVANRLGKEPPVFDGESLEPLLRYGFPGNIRELQNIVERAVILAGPGKPATVEVADDAGRPTFEAGGDDLAAVSRAHILRILNETNWVVGGPYGAAVRLKMKRSTLNFRMKKLGIERPTRSGAGPLGQVSCRSNNRIERSGEVAQMQPAVPTSEKAK